MSTRECPCRHCTTETGRGPGCHSESCPHGWADWNREHVAERERRRAIEAAEQAATAIAVERARRTRRESKSKERG